MRTMSLAYYSVAIAAAIPYLVLGLTLIPSRTVPARWGKGYDNRDPRRESEKLVGWRRRAHNAQANSYEVFPAFAASVIMAVTMRGSSPVIDAWAVAFVASRVLFCAFYVTDLATARSTMWAIGALCIGALFAIAAGA